MPERSTPECTCKCPACFDNDCEDGCSDANCIEVLCRDPNCSIRSDGAALAMKEQVPSPLIN